MIEQPADLNWARGTLRCLWNLAAERVSCCHPKRTWSIPRHARSSWQTFDFQIEKSSSGESIECRHRGLIALVTVQDEVHFIGGVEDVVGVELIDPTQHTVEEFTPTFAYALALLDSETDLRGY